MAVLVKNKKAFFDYHILERIEAGIELSGKEVKSIRSGKISLSGAFVSIRKGEAYLVNANIAPYQPKNTPEEYNPKKERRLLLKKKELDSLYGKMKEGGVTLVPLSIYTKGNFLKLELGIVKGKKKYDKREAIKKREIDREIKRKMKH